MKGDMALIFCGARMSYDCSRSNENEIPGHFKF